VTVLILIVALILIAAILVSERRRGRRLTPGQRRLAVASMIAGFLLALIVRWP